MNIATSSAADEEEISPVEDENQIEKAPKGNAQTTNARDENESQSLSDGLFLPFGLDDSTFYRDGSRRLQPAETTRLQATVTEPFYDGLIPINEDEVSPISPNSAVSVSIDSQGPLESNLLGLLGPQPLAAPAPRWTVPPQWLQFQMLRSYDEGLILSDREDTEIPLGLPRSAHPDEVEVQVQLNLQNLLQQQATNSTKPSPRWEALPEWIQPSIDEHERGFVKPQMQEFFDGLIAVEDEHPSDSVAQAPPMRGPSVPEDERQLQANLLRLLQPIEVRREQRSPSLMSVPRTAEMNEESPLPTVICSFGLMRRTGIHDRKLEFDTVEFNSINALSFPRRLQSQASKSMGLMFLIITDWQLWFLDSLQTALPGFPIQTLLHLSSSKATTMLPTVDHNEGELSCVMEHINTRHKTLEKPDNETEIDIGHVKAQCLPLVVWTRAENAIDGQPDQPLIVVISRCKRDISAQITGHYLIDDYKRWDRLNGNHAWVYLDLYFLFTKWDRVWGAVKQNLSLRTEEVVHGRSSVIPILDQTRQLHNDNDVMISLREHIRIHKASLKVVKQRVEKMLGGPEWLDTQHLKGRLEDAFELLEYYDVTATTLLEQQQNLMSLAFNLENVAQGQAVARLNALALVFLPLSYVSSIFGITTFTAAAKWYPVAAVPVLLATVFVAYTAHIYFSSKSPTPMSSYSSLSSNVCSQNDVEKQPPNLLLKWTQFFSRANVQSLKEQELSASYDLNNITVNDPSRLARKSTNRSLADPNFVPPQSTVQYLPSAYDLSSGLMPHFGALSQRDGSFTTHNGSIGESLSRIATSSAKTATGKENTNRGVLRRPFGFDSLDEDLEA